MKATIYKPLGFLFVGIAVLGIFLPLLPATPFLLVAAGCFARSSQRWHDWLTSNRVFGPVISDWHERQCVTQTTRTVALLSIFLFGGMSMLLANLSFELKVIGAIVIVTGLFCVLRLKVCLNK